MPWLCQICTMFFLALLSFLSDSIHGVVTKHAVRCNQRAFCWDVIPELSIFFLVLSERSHRTPAISVESIKRSIHCDVLSEASGPWWTPFLFWAPLGKRIPFKSSPIRSWNVEHVPDHYYCVHWRRMFQIHAVHSVMKRIVLVMNNPRNEFLYLLSCARRCIGKITFLGSVRETVCRFLIQKRQIMVRNCVLLLVFSTSRTQRARNWHISWIWTYPTDFNRSFRCRDPPIRLQCRFQSRLFVFQRGNRAKHHFLYSDWAEFRKYGWLWCVCRSNLRWERGQICGTQHQQWIA